LASAFVPYTTQYPQVGWHEQRPEDWWNAVVESTRKLLKSNGVDKNDIVCLGISGHSLGAVPVDKAGNLLRDGTPIWSDIRAQQEVEDFFKEIDPDGTFHSRTKEMPMSAWTVLIKDHHEAYITWDEFMRNQKALERNRTNGEETLLGGAAREGLALLQGLLLCGHCGRRITVRYKGNGGIYPVYECNWRRREGLSTASCSRKQGSPYRIGLSRPRRLEIPPRRCPERVSRGGAGWRRTP